MLKSGSCGMVVWEPSGMGGLRGPGTHCKTMWMPERVQPSAGGLEKRFQLPGGGGTIGHHSLFCFVLLSKHA